MTDESQFVFCMKFRLFVFKLVGENRVIPYSVDFFVFVFSYGE